MTVFSLRLILGFGILFHFATSAFAGYLDDYYLQQSGEAKSVQLQKALLSLSPEAQETAQCGMPFKHGLSRDWNKLETTTQKVLAKQLAAPTLSGSEQTLLSDSGRFLIHYTTSNGDMVPSLGWVQTVAQTLDDVAAAYLARSWRLAPTVNGAPYDVYLRNLAPSNLYGQVTAPPNSNFAVPSPGFNNAYASYMELDNNYTDSIYKTDIYTPLQSLQITAAHEYHHAVQYGYNYYFDIWYAEASSTWMEDELFDSVNQLYNYIPAWFINSTKSLDLSVGSDAISSGAGYGRWIFNRYLSEKHTPAMVRGAWEKVGGLASPGGADIPMAPVLDGLLSSTYASSLGIAFLDFTKRVYTREWTSHNAEIAKIHPFAPLASYSAFPVDANISPAPAITLPHYSFAYYKFVPSPGVPGDLAITVTGTSGITATAFRKDGSAIAEFPFAGVSGATITVPGFNTSSEVVLLITNATASDDHSANFSTNGTGQPVQDPVGGTVYPPLPPTATTNDGGSSSGGCFIATAAYGSYLHPEVQLLRNFRDQHLLTNAPGRAFVAIYYRCSPPLADFIGRHTVLRIMTRLLLTPLVVAFVYPLVSAGFMLLLIGTVLISRQRRTRCRLNAHPSVIKCFLWIIHTTSYRL